MSFVFSANSASSSFTTGKCQHAAYEEFDKRSGITLIHCMAHARRRFSDALENDKARAEYALSMFQKLYVIERRVKNEELSAEAILQLRQQEAVPILKQLKDWMTEEYAKVLPKSPIGQAMAYSLPRCAYYGQSLPLFQCKVYQL